MFGSFIILTCSVFENKFLPKIYPNCPLETESLAPTNGKDTSFKLEHPYIAPSAIVVTVSFVPAACDDIILMFWIFEQFINAPGATTVSFKIVTLIKVSGIKNECFFVVSDSLGSPVSFWTTWYAELNAPSFVPSASSEYSPKM